MNRLDSDIQMVSPVRLARRVANPVVDSRRLVVVILHTEEEALLASRISEVAKPQGMSVLLIGVVPSPTREAELRRQLVTIAAFLREEGGSGMRNGSQAAKSQRVDVRIERGRDWIAAIKAQLQPGDMVACYSEQKVGVLEKPLSDILSSSLALPIYTFAGLRAQRASQQSLFGEIASWAASLASIGGFFLLQARIVTAVQGWMQSALMLIALIVEAAFIWFLNSLLGRF